MLVFIITCIITCTGRVIAILHTYDLIETEQGQSFTNILRQATSHGFLVDFVSKLLARCSKNFTYTLSRIINKQTPILFFPTNSSISIDSSSRTLLSSLGRGKSDFHFFSILMCYFISISLLFSHRSRKDSRQLFQPNRDQQKPWTHHPKNLKNQPEVGFSQTYL